ncbi:MAG TPA: hypothetical protein VK961_18345 [Chthoniobacter sp.]|nr:hypothetical protein [Chthoniobacter sp.]
MASKLRRFTDAIAEMLAPDGFSIGKVFRDYIPFRKEQNGLLLEYNFDVLAKYGLQVEARIRVRHHQTEEIFNRILPPESTEPDAALRTSTVYASVGRVVVWKQPFWHIFKDPLIARVRLYEENDVAKAVEKQRKLYDRYVRDAFAEVGSLSAIEQHLNRDISKDALYAENRYIRATRGIVTAKLCGRQDLPQLIASHRAALVKHKYADKMDAYDKLATRLQSES